MSEIVDTVNELIKTIGASQQPIAGFVLRPFKEGEHRATFFNCHEAEKVWLRPGLGAAMIMRLKIMAGVDVAESTQPQIGYIRLDKPDRLGKLTLVLYTRPTSIGEEILVRQIDETDPTLPRLAEEAAS